MQAVDGTQKKALESCINCVVSTHARIEIYPPSKLEG